MRDVALVNAYRNKFIIPLDFEMLVSTMSYYQSWLGNLLCYEIMFKDYDRVIVLPGSPPKSDTKYKITKVSLEYKIVTQPDLEKRITLEYQSMAFPMTGLSGTDTFHCITQIRKGAGHSVCLVSP